MHSGAATRRAAVAENHIQDHIHMSHPRRIRTTLITSRGHIQNHIHANCIELRGPAALSDGLAMLCVDYGQLFMSVRRITWLLTMCSHIAWLFMPFCSNAWLLTTYSSSSRVILAFSPSTWLFNAFSGSSRLQ